MRCVPAAALICLAILSVPPALGAGSAARLAADLVDIPAGEFRMGDAAGDADERVVKNVRVEALRIGRNDVTRGQFSEFVRATGYRTDAERNAAGTTGCYTMETATGKWADHPGRDWRDPGFPQTDLHPVVCVSWNDVQAYIRWLNGQTGKTFRLLSEVEWEYAARAGSVTRYPWGAEATCRYANAADESPWPYDSAGRAGRMKCDDGFSYTSPVGRYPPNDWGLYDMVGNVWEWTADCYRDSYNDARVEISTACARPLLRGGSWFDIPDYLRVSNRYWIAMVSARASFLGFRLAQDR